MSGIPVVQLRQPGDFGFRPDGPPHTHVVLTRQEAERLIESERKTDEWRDRAFDALDALKIANDNCEHLQTDCALRNGTHP